MTAGPWIERFGGKKSGKCFENYEKKQIELANSGDVLRWDE